MALQCADDVTLNDAEDKEALMFHFNINECEYSEACISDTTVCVNNPGSYDCVCKKGYYLTAPSQGQSYNPMYNTCNAKETQWRDGSIALGVIFAVCIVSVVGYIYITRKDGLNEIRNPTKS
ncbi:hypothetical protein TNCT_632301 [Trichonephila clavata]|uniref:EGF-like domain-containing protein n=1 Tax=Trichonephila clavata TaxID=2740835 RepID=A0A8X6KUC2_TRICU|nr:hypothetical protein TNCT_632301 [Trichonephila clavata]